VIIFVKDSNNRVLSPTTKVDWVKKIVKQGKGRLILRKLITLQLHYSVTSQTNDDYNYTIGIDAGYSNIGFCVLKISKSKIILLFKGEFEFNTASISQNLTKRKMYRRIRRRNRRKNCKHPKFRKPRWKNRRNKLKHSPSMRYLHQMHVNLFINFIFKYVENTKSIINLEYGKFDTQALSNNYGKVNSKSNFYNVKAFVLFRDQYTCQKCRVRNTSLHVHHIKFRSDGGSNAPDNLVTVCSNCHTKIHENKISNKFNLNSDNFKSSGLFNSTMKSINNTLSSNVPTYKYFGYETKYYREVELKLSKTHENDALALSLMNVDFKDKIIIKSNIESLKLKQYRRHNRSATKRIDDRRYYRNNICISKNRSRRCSQTDLSYSELKNKNGLTVKKGQIVYEKRTKDKPFTPGDMLIDNAVVTGYSTTQNRVYSSTHYYNLRKIKRLRRNSGLVIT
jgi:hypothetical protein